MAKVSDFESEDCRFESCQGRFFLNPFILIVSVKMFIVVSRAADSDLIGPVPVSGKN